MDTEMRLYVVHIINIDDNNCKYQCYKKFRNILLRGIYEL